MPASSTSMGSMKCLMKLFNAAKKRVFSSSWIYAQWILDSAKCMCLEEVVVYFTIFGIYNFIKGLKDYVNKSF